MQTDAQTDGGERINNQGKWNGFKSSLMLQQRNELMRCMCVCICACVEGGNGARLDRVGSVEEEEDDGEEEEDRERDEDSPWSRLSTNHLTILGTTVPIRSWNKLQHGWQADKLAGWLAFSWNTGVVVASYFFSSKKILDAQTPKNPGRGCFI